MVMGTLKHEQAGKSWNWSMRLPSKLSQMNTTGVACTIKGKQHKASYKAITAVSTISEPLQLLHMDLFGPTSIRSIDHKYYSLVVTDDFSRFSWVFFLGTKDETFYLLRDFITFVENQLTKSYAEELARASKTKNMAILQQRYIGTLLITGSLLLVAIILLAFLACRSLGIFHSPVLTGDFEEIQFVEAMQEEMQSFVHQEVVEVVPLPEGKTAIGTKWILKNKRDARVAFELKFRLFLAFASYMGFMVYQMDVKSAFLYGEIDEEVYVTQPKGFEDPFHPKHVYRVVKALYGLHQATSGWHGHVYVDDIIFGSTNKAWCDKFEVLMKGEFEMSTMGELTFFLGLQVIQKSNEMSTMVPTGRYVVPTGKVIATYSVIVATSGYVVPAAYDISPGE
ncbi:putative ribonuclease H-like domain-containing protein [Tanacetum coccineum]